MNNRGLLIKKMEEEERKRRKEKNRKEHGKTKKEIKKMYKQEKLAKLRAERKVKEEAEKNLSTPVFKEVLSGNITGARPKMNGRKSRSSKRWQGWNREEAPGEIITYRLEQ
ncbi:hypothetical protein_gp260 [Bacillus phage vB_BceM_WH1]|nr:hypothetical protein_gp260 [Bacillus phage vB_BceM_WH1]